MAPREKTKKTILNVCYVCYVYIYLEEISQKKNEQCGKMLMTSFITPFLTKILTDPHKHFKTNFNG